MLGKSLSFKSVLDSNNTKIYEDINLELFNALGMGDWDDLPEGSADIINIAAEYVGRGVRRYIIEKDDTWF